MVNLINTQSKYQTRPQPFREITMGTPNKIPTSLEAVSSSSVPPPPPWVELPGDVTANILQRLGAEEVLCSAQRVCTSWWKVCQDPAIWRVLSLRDLERTNEVCATMCRRAVDLSQGQLVDLSIDYFGDDTLLDYVAKRSPNLKRLALTPSVQLYSTLTYYGISPDSLVQAVKILPHLVELHLTLTDTVFAVHVEAIGFSCPTLKSFSYSNQGCKIQYWRDDDDDGDDDDDNGDFMQFVNRDEYALAIGKSMPNLRHLQLLANRMRNKGLEAILEGCPHLESLDIRQCLSLDLGGDLGRRCREKIKDLKLPSDSISDIVWLANESSDDCGYSSYGDDYPLGSDDEYY